ncbi:MAG: hypothetical protein AAGJ52_13815 [Pseudomonadota bacterium]
MNDREAIQALIDEMYALISGPGEKARDWERQGQLFMPGTRMIRTRLNDQGLPEPEVLLLEDYGENYKALKGGRDFYEIEVRNTIQIFGQVAQVFSVYEAFSDAEHQQRLKRGVNVIQCYRFDEGWKITAMAWDDERPGLLLDDESSIR